MERTLVIIKPDAVQRRLIGRVISRLEDKGLRVSAMRMLRLTETLAAQLYREHAGKGFYDKLVAFMTSSPLMAIAVEGTEAISVVRGLIGPTDGTEAPPGTVRGDFGLSTRHNLVHASDGAASAARELAVFFTEEDYLGYEITDEQWVRPEL